MTLDDINTNQSYVVTNMDNLTKEEQTIFQEIGLGLGDIITKHQSINSSSKVCIFDFENLTYSINIKYAQKIILQKLYCKENFE